MDQNTHLRHTQYCLLLSQPMAYGGWPPTYNKANLWKKKISKTNLAKNEGSGDPCSLNAASYQGQHFLLTGISIGNEKNGTSTPDTPKFGNGLVQLIRMEKSTGQIWVNHSPVTTYLYRASVRVNYDQALESEVALKWICMCGIRFCILQ